MSLVLSLKGAESWLAAALRQAADYGLEWEVEQAYHKHIANGCEPPDAALNACIDWDVSDLCTWVVPQPGDRVRIVDIHPEDAYYNDEDGVRDVVFIVDHDYMITNHGDGWFGFDAYRENTLRTDIFYKVRVVAAEEGA